MAALGLSRPLILTGRSGAPAGELNRAVLRLTGRGGSHLPGVPRHSSLGYIERAVQVARERDSDCLVAVGGGSVIDTAKAVVVSLAEDGPLQELATRFEVGIGFVTPPLLRPKRPILAVPVTPSGAEMTPAFGVRDEEGHKLLFWDAQVPSRVVLLDGAAAAHVPAQALLASGMNGLAHCLEALYAKNRSPLTSAMAVEGAEMFGEAMVELASAPESLECRHRLLVAGHMGGAVLASAGSCLHHAVCHVLGALSGRGHGALNAVILPHALQFNACAGEAELAPLRVAGGDVAAWVRELQARTGVPSRLRDLGIDRTLLPSAARQVLRERGIANNPRPVDSEDDIRSLLEQAW